MKYFFVCTLGVLIFLGGCIKDVNIDLPYEGNKIVVNTLIQPDSVVYVRVTRSEPTKVYDDSGYKDIPGSNVTLTVDGVPFSPLQVQVIKGLSYFVSEQKAVRGRQYGVKVTAPGLETVTGMDTLPAAPDVKNATAQRNSSRVQFTLKDSPAARNYYRIRIYVTDDNGGQGTYRLFRLDPAFNNSLNDFFTTSSYSSLVMSDERFDGKEVNFVLQTADPITGFSRVNVEISALTRVTYDYFNTVAAQRQNGIILTGNPVRVFTNVSNGYGIVGGINTKKLVFRVE